MLAYNSDINLNRKEYLMAIKKDGKTEYKLLLQLLGLLRTDMQIMYGYEPSPALMQFGSLLRCAKFDVEKICNKMVC